MLMILRGVRYLRQRGIIATVIAIFFFINRKIKHHLIPIYYEKGVRETAKTIGSNLNIHGKAIVNERTAFGDNVHIGGLEVSGNGSLKIGDNFHCGGHCRIYTQHHNYDKGDAIPYDNTFIVKDIIIEDNVWLGSEVTILPGSVIKEGAVIQNGSTVVDHIPKGAVAGGHPAKVFKKRDMDHYERLKSEGKFH